MIFRIGEHCLYLLQYFLMAKLLFCDRIKLEKKRYAKHYPKHKTETNFKAFSSSQQYG